MARADCGRRNRTPALIGLALTLLLVGCPAAAAEWVAAGPSIITESGLLPKGTRLAALTIRQPRRVLTVERLGQAQNELAALGNMAFSAADLMGGVARQAGISCATCHSSGEINRDFLVPGRSAHPGSVDVGHRLFDARSASAGRRRRTARSGPSSRTGARRCDGSTPPPKRVIGPRPQLASTTGSRK